MLITHVIDFQERSKKAAAAIYGWDSPLLTVIYQRVFSMAPMGGRAERAVATTTPAFMPGMSQKDMAWAVCLQTKSYCRHILAMLRPYRPDDFDPLKKLEWHCQWQHLLSASKLCTAVVRR